MKFVEMLSAELVTRGISKRDLAKLSGVPEGTVYSWFSAKANEPSVEAAMKVGRALGLSINYLVTGESTPINDVDPGWLIQETWEKKNEGLLADLKSLDEERLENVTRMVRDIAAQARTSAEVSALKSKHIAG